MTEQLPAWIAPDYAAGMAMSQLGSLRRRRRSRVLCLCTALSWLGWAVAAPSAWSGCTFQLSGYFGTTIKIVAADDVDLSKVARVYVKVSSPDQAEFEVAKPAGGWPKEVETSYAQQNPGPFDLTVTAYDGSSQLMALGRNETQDHIVITVQSTIPWS
jgi:hypothetical protein